MIHHQPAFGQRIRALRRARGLTQTQVAGDAISVAYLSRLESGARAPTARVIGHLSRQLHADLDVKARPDLLVDALMMLAAETVAPASLDAVEGAIGASTDPNEADLRRLVTWHLALARARAHDRGGEQRALAAIIDAGGGGPLVSRAHSQLAVSLRDAGHLGQALVHAERGRELGAPDETDDQLRALSVMVSVLAESGDLDRAETCAEELRTITARTGGAVHAKALWSAATVASRAHRHERADTLLREAIGELDSRDDLTLWLRLRLAAASLALQTDPPRPVDARTHLDSADAALSLVGSRQQVVEAVLLRAELAYADGDDATATSLLDDPDDEAFRLLTFYDQARLSVLRARLQLRRGRRAEAERLLRSMARRADEIGDAQVSARLWRELALAMADSNEPTT